MKITPVKEPWSIFDLLKRKVFTKRQKKRNRGKSFFFKILENTQKIVYKKP